jgi:hypothetical protein
MTIFKPVNDMDEMKAMATELKGRLQDSDMAAATFSWGDTDYSLCLTETVEEGFDFHLSMVKIEDHEMSKISDDEASQILDALFDSHEERTPTSSRIMGLRHFLGN